MSSGAPPAQRDLEMNIATNIGLVTGGLSLIAFIVTAGLYAYRAKLKGKQAAIESVPPQDRAATINDMAEYLRIDTSGMDEVAKERIVFAQLKQKGRRDLLLFAVSIFISILLALIAIISIGGGNSKISTKDFSAIGDHVKVDCEKDGKSNVSYTADDGYHIQNVYADVYEPSEVRNTNAIVVSNNGMTATAAATFSGRKKNFGVDCPSSGSAQVRIFGTIAKNRGWLSILYERLIAGLFI